MPFAIETRGLTRRFGAHIAVDGVDLLVPEGSVFGFLGRNGAGKTTTLKLLLGLLRADAGTVHICGIDLAADRLAAAREVGALLEAHGLYPHLTGHENLQLTCRLRGVSRTDIARVLAITELQDAAHRRVGDYSLGMRQRLGLARALLGHPKLLILDEPSNGLDPEGMADLRRLLRSLPAQSGTTVLLSSHLLGEIEQTASHIGILSAGRLIRQGALDALKASLSTALWVGTATPTAACEIVRAQGYACTAADDGVRVDLPAGEPVAAAASRLNGLLCAAGLSVHALMPAERSLESLYRNAGAHADAPYAPALAA